MAIQQQPQAAPQTGGLNQARPPQPAQPPKQENLAARAAGMEQEETTAPEDFFTKTMRDLQTQRSALNAQTAKLLESLDARQNRPFDPMLMKMAAGFAKPTKTGSFGESLGYAMEGAAEESEKEFVRQQATEKLKQELLQKQMEQAQLQARQSFLKSKMEPQGVPTPSAPASAISTPTGEAAERTPGVPMAAQPGVQVAAAPSPARRGLTISSEDIKQAMFLDPSGKDAQALRELMKAEIDREKMLQETDPNRIVEVDFGPLFSGPKKVPYSTYSQWLDIHNSGDRAKELEFFYKKNWLKRPAGEKTDQAPVEPETADERKRREEIAQERLKAQVGQEKEQIGRLDTNFTQSRTIINAANGIKTLATSNPLGFDLMNKPGIAAAIGRAAESSPFNLPVKELASFNLSEGDRNALQMVQRDIAELTVQFRKAARVPGEGTTTEKEGDLYQALGIMKNDSSKVVRAKAEFLELKGKYDQEIFKAWSKFSKDPNNSYRDFLASDQFNQIADAYDKRLGELQRSYAIDLNKGKKAEPSKAPVAPAAPAAPQKASTQQPSSGGRPNQRIINGMIWERQEDGSWKNSGKAAQ